MISIASVGALPTASFRYSDLVWAISQVFVAEHKGKEKTMRAGGGSEPSCCRSFRR